MGVALSADVHRLQDARVAQLHHDPLLGETQRLPVVVGFDAAHKVRLAHHHLRQEVHQGVLRISHRTGNELSCEITSFQFTHNDFTGKFKWPTFSFPVAAEFLDSY